MFGRSTIATLLLTAHASANIIFSWVQPECNHNATEGHQGCLREQYCREDDTCEMNWGPKLQEGVTMLEKTAARDDGRCGPDYDDATCDANGPYGDCCSQDGYCGSTPEHCLKSNGCINGCTSDPSSVTEQATPNPTQSEPVIGPPSTPSGASPTGAVTTDGSCGAANNGEICGDWHLGSCCSMYGYCGSTTSHCGDGCQSGPCLQAPVVAAPGPVAAPPNDNPGSFAVIGQSGVPAMHAALMPNGRVVFLDKVENYTQLKRPNGQYAYSAEYDPATNQVVPLAYKTNAFCAGGSFLENGTLVSIGGNGPLTWLDPTVSDGFKGLRYLTRSSTSGDLNGEDWLEPGHELNTARWYPSAQTLADGTIFVASGSLNGLDPTISANNNPTYEILDQNGISQEESVTLPLLQKAQPYYMYPFIHLLPTNELFIFTSKSSEVLTDLSNNVRTSLPDLPGDYRTYPNTGGSVLLPLSSAHDWAPSILICGGGAYQDVTSPTDASCGRINPLDGNPTWAMDAMPAGRGMVEATLLPDGTVLWLNGAGRGAQGFGLATDPTFEALIYDPEATLGDRWTRGASSRIPRLYHSVALLLLDGTVMIAGSNPVQMPVLEASTENPFPTEFRVEIYTPPYLSGDRANLRPTDIALSKTTLDIYTEGNVDTFDLTFTSPPNAQKVQIALYHGGFVTHSLHMSHRMLFLDNIGWTPEQTSQKVTASLPNTSALAPPGPYVVYVVVDGVPGIGQFVTVTKATADSRESASRSVATRDEQAVDPAISARAGLPFVPPGALACGVMDMMPCPDASSDAGVLYQSQSGDQSRSTMTLPTITITQTVSQVSTTSASSTPELTASLTVNQTVQTSTAPFALASTRPNAQILALGMESAARRAVDHAGTVVAACVGIALFWLL